MKHKEFNKKLSLRKTTISNLNRDEMNRVFGGDSNPCAFTPGCPPSVGCPISGASCPCPSTTTVTIANL
jgi:natural product precursor